MASLRHLLVCGRCRRQLDAGDRGAGEFVRCPCGEQVEVPALEPHDSAVVRCSACGAPRAGDEMECRYCGSSFTVHERDLDTICPGCMARVSGSARFCSHCGSPILVDQATASETPLPCPACGAPRLLASRRLAGEPVAVSECARCGGLWVDKSVFEILAARARHAEIGSAALAVSSQAPATAGERTSKAAAAGAAGPAGTHLYRPCAVCGKLMNRQNFGHKSGVIVDVCASHGIWFDLDELPRLLRWVQDGGEQRARQRDEEEATTVARERRLDEWESPRPGGGGWMYVAAEPDLLGSLLDLLGDGVRRLFHRP